MKMTIDIYDERKKEIELFFDALNELEQMKSKESNHSFYNDEFFKILKANALIMIYNLVESSIMGGIMEIYEALKSLDYCYRDVRKEIQDIWFSFKFSQVYDKKAHFNAYRAKATEIISAIIDNKPLEMARKAADISGNLDAKKIMKICKKHGIVYNIDPTCRGGIVLEDVKNKRNELAHGTISFAECGRNYTINDLEKIKTETTSFLNSILEGMKHYYDEKKYCASLSVAM
jgi:hypothetical protein